ncbi:MAG: sulfotransferase [Planctomycetota bacterium]
MRTGFFRIRSVAILVMIAPLLAIHRVAWWLDERLFKSLPEVRKPLFIVGVPRSGTTLAHRLVASQQSVFTTFPLWELLFAPALCEKYALAGIMGIDRLIGSPAATVVRWVQSRIAKSIADVHPTTLDAPEEDYLGLLPFGGCFLKVLMSPHDERVWQLVAREDASRTKFVRLYRGLLARHLRFRGEQMTIVSKNPSFTNWIEALAKEFPDARFIGLRRSLNESLPSQLSSMRGGFAMFGHDVADPRVVERFLAMYHSYWNGLERCRNHLLEQRFQLIEYSDLRERCWATISGTLDRFGIQSREDERQELHRLCEQSQNYVSRHRYDPAEFGLTPDQLRPTSASSNSPFDSATASVVDLAEMTQPPLPQRSIPCAQR